ncbi:hypothetical protein DFS34DRAFT_608235 [Phlyctochytrium arcticum]|nr:hypothetical protein DFS34DRAFT_608235 [Phlyctochytrium arcticum]
MEPLGVPNCDCNLLAVKHIVRKKTANIGRPFYTCQRKGYHPNFCSFYKWGDGRNYSLTTGPPSGSQTTASPSPQKRPHENDEDFSLSQQPPDKYRITSFTPQHAGNESFLYKDDTVDDDGFDDGDLASIGNLVDHLSSQRQASLEIDRGSNPFYVAPGEASVPGSQTSSKGTLEPEYYHPGDSIAGVRLSSGSTTGHLEGYQNDSPRRTDTTPLYTKDGISNAQMQTPKRVGGAMEGGLPTPQTSSAKRNLGFDLLALSQQSSSSFASSIDEATADPALSGVNSSTIKAYVEVLEKDVKRKDRQIAALTKTRDHLRQELQIWRNAKPTTSKSCGKCGTNI